MMKKSKILVLGASGFIGQQILQDWGAQAVGTYKNTRYKNTVYFNPLTMRINQIQGIEYCSHAVILYGEREPRLQALRGTLSDEGTPLDLHCTTSDARTVFIQFEVSSSLPAAQAFGRWFHEVYLPEVYPLQAERALDPAFHYPLTVFPR